MYLHNTSIYYHIYILNLHISNIINELLPFNYPIKLETAILGGILTNIGIALYIH